MSAATFAGHARPGMTLGELGAAAAGAEVDVVTVLGGKVPVHWDPDDTVAVLRFGDGAAYLRVEGSLSLSEVTAALAGAGQGARVVEIGYEPPLTS